MPNGTPTKNRPLARLALRITSCAHQGLERLIRLLHLLLHLGRSLLDLFQTLRTALTQPSTCIFSLTRLPLLLPPLRLLLLLLLPSPPRQPALASRLTQPNRPNRGRLAK
uniref:Agnoprotein 2a n=1 Tax=Budgerigar fledgling disease virus TaxID=1891747 RepID=A0A0K1L9D7_BFPYV|nr:agnoprotein 2a [Gammapolyomavirus avis]